MAVPDVIWERDGDATLVADARYFPLIISTFTGATTEKIMCRYFAWNNAQAERADRENTKFITLSDARLAKRPDATVRKTIAELSDEAPAALHERHLPSVLVLESAIVRGALTAIQWMSRNEFKTLSAPTMAAGFERVLASLAAERISIPSGLDPATYVAPALPGEDGKVPA